MDDETIRQIPGAAELVDWFGHFPTFHDGHLTGLSIDVDGRGSMRLDGFQTTDQKDEKGYFILDKRFSCTMILEGIRSVELSEFKPGSATLFEVEVTYVEDVFEIIFGSSYGVEGRIRTANLRIEFEPLLQ